MNTNGARNITASAIRMLWSATPQQPGRRPPVPAAGARLAGGGERLRGRRHQAAARVVDPAVRATQEQEREAEGEDEQDHGHRRGVAQVEVAEALLVEHTG